MARASVVAVDLAYKRARDIGVCVLASRARGISAEFVALAEGGPERTPTPEWVAGRCAQIASQRGARLLLLDGPQAWKDADNGLAHSRLCERALHTPAKTGEPGCVKPRPYTAFVTFSIAVFDALAERGWPRLEAARAPRGQRALEVFPHAAWKRLGLEPLPAKAKCSPQRLATCARALCERFRIRVNRAPSHDELQALVAGVAGLALLARDSERYELLGAPPRIAAGSWREGFILAPRSHEIAPTQRPRTVSPQSSAQATARE